MEQLRNVSTVYCIFRFILLTVPYHLEHKNVAYQQAWNLKQEPHSWRKQVAVEDNLKIL